jgi:hypothetical protein
MACVQRTGEFELAELHDPNGIVADESTLYIADDHQILAYSTDPVVLQWQFGEQGEGPTQFQYRAHVKLAGDSILAYDFTKSIWLSKDGDLLGHKSFADFDWFDPGMEMQLMQLGESYVRVTVDHDLDAYYVDLLDPGFEPTERLLDGHYDWRFVIPNTDSLKTVGRLVDALVHEDKVFVADAHRGFFFDVFDRDGNRLYSIDKNEEVPPVTLDEEYRTADIEFWRGREDMQGLFASGHEFTFAYPKQFPSFHYVQVSDSKIYATTYKVRDGKHEVIVLDLRGNILDRLYLPLESMRYHGRSILPSELYAIFDGRVYELIENPADSTWRLRISMLP